MIVMLCASLWEPPKLMGATEGYGDHQSKSSKFYCPKEKLISLKYFIFISCIKIITLTVIKKIAENSYSFGERELIKECLLDVANVIFLEKKTTSKKFLIQDVLSDK